MGSLTEVVREKDGGFLTGFKVMVQNVLYLSKQLFLPRLLPRLLYIPGQE